MDEKLIAERISNIIIKGGGECEISQIPGRYKEEYGESIKPKLKLKKFIMRFNEKFVIIPGNGKGEKVTLTHGNANPTTTEGNESVRTDAPVAAVFELASKLTLKEIDANRKVEEDDMSDGRTTDSSCGDYDCMYNTSNTQLRSATLLDRKALIQHDLQGGLLGRVEDGDSKGADLFLNVTDPFCLICVGLQGEGKSHTMNTVLENCMMQDNTDQNESDPPVIFLKQRMCTLVMHYDTTVDSICESIGLRKNVQRPVVLVSPTYYEQKRCFYGDDIDVIPLLFRWQTLNAEQLRKLMHLSPADSQLYVSSLLNKLRDYQRQNKKPTWEEFLEECKSFTSPGQAGPLTQRLKLLESFIFEADDNENLRYLYANIGDVTGLFSSGALVIADMSDPMMSNADASGIFQVLLSLFHAKELPCGKVVVLDEAHRYLSGEHDDLAADVVGLFRVMRHSGIRVLVSTQSPLTMPKEMIELASVTVLHRFNSKEWFSYLAGTKNLSDEKWDLIPRLDCGHALVCCDKIYVEKEKKEPTTIMHIRKRLTVNHGASKRSK